MPKMIITVDVATGNILEVEKDANGTRQRVYPGPEPKAGTYRYIGTLLSYTGSNCITLNIPGGGSYTICI